MKNLSDYSLHYFLCAFLKTCYKEVVYMKFKMQMLNYPKVKNS